MEARLLDPREQEAPLARVLRRRATSVALGVAAFAATMLPHGEADATEARLSVYKSVNSRKTCAYTSAKASADGPMSCEFLCEGPASGVRTRLLSCGDYEHLYVEIDAAAYSTWDAMLAVGRFSGIANKNGIVEWIFARGERRSRANLKGLIVRFQGLDQDDKERSALAVFSLAPGRICWTGNYASNDEARLALESGPCKGVLKPRLP